MKRSPGERHTQTHRSLIETFWWSLMSEESKSMWIHGKTWQRLYHVFTYIDSLLIEKHICDCRNVSVELPCVSVCLSSGDLFIFSMRVSSFFSYFCVTCTSLLSFPLDTLHFIFYRTMIQLRLDKLKYRKEERKLEFQPCCVFLQHYLRMW